MLQMQQIQAASRSPHVAAVAAEQRCRRSYRSVCAPRTSNLARQGVRVGSLRNGRRLIATCSARKDKPSLYHTQPAPPSTSRPKPTREATLGFLQKLTAAYLAAAISSSSVVPQQALAWDSPQAPPGTTRNVSADGRSSGSGGTVGGSQDVDIDALPPTVEASLGDEAASVTKGANTLIETWNVVKASFVDEDLNRLDWDKTLMKTLSKGLENPVEDAYSRINSMLVSLDDPYTRILSPSVVQDFYRVPSPTEPEEQEQSPPGIFDDAIPLEEPDQANVGLSIAARLAGGYMRVLSTIDGSPAARAGIEAGDVLWSIDGVSTYGESYETAFARLQGNEGSTVEVEVVPWRDLGTGGTEQTVSASGRQKVQLVRESVQKVPVSFSIFESKGTNSLAQTSGDAGVADESSPREPELVGYIRLANFEEHTAESVANAVATCKFFGVSSFIMDMRNNTDGSVVEGLEVAKLFLDGGMRIVNVVGREGKSATVGLKPGTSALAREPLIVLVNRGSANTAEVLAGALKFNQRAVLVGERTYGQGRIQHQFPMKDGSQLFVTVAKYATPDAHNIDQVGVAPDVACSDAPRMDVTSEGVRRIKDDSCIADATKVIQQVQEEMGAEQQQLKVVSETDLEVSEGSQRSWM
mmetsp:Transcript_7826/g.28942  ORF Transcript_7826/g.28942 Transcript_7826/m.28942 type:complete len:640 (+) Transcript_7826:126-2045(+)